MEAAVSLHPRAISALTPVTRMAQDALLKNVSRDNFLLLMTLSRRSTQPASAAAASILRRTVGKSGRLCIALDIEIPR